MQLAQWNPFREMDEMPRGFRPGLSRDPSAPLADRAPAVHLPKTDIKKPATKTIKVS